MLQVWNQNVVQDDLIDRVSIALHPDRTTLGFKHWYDLRGEGVIQVTMNYVPPVPVSPRAAAAAAAAVAEQAAAARAAGAGVGTPSSASASPSGGASASGGAATAPSAKAAPTAVDGAPLGTAAGDDDPPVPLLWACDLESGSDESDEEQPSSGLDFFS